MSDFWKIENDPPPNSGVGNALKGLQIQPVFNSNTPPAITGYNLMNGSNLLSAEEALVSQWGDPPPQKFIEHVSA